MDGSTFDRVEAEGVGAVEGGRGLGQPVAFGWQASAMEELLHLPLEPRAREAENAARRLSPSAAPPACASPLMAERQLFRWRHAHRTVGRTF